MITEGASIKFYALPSYHENKVHPLHSRNFKKSIFLLFVKNYPYKIDILNRRYLFTLLFIQIFFTFLPYLKLFDLIRPKKSRNETHKNDSHTRAILASHICTFLLFVEYFTQIPSSIFHSNTKKNPSLIIFYETCNIFLLNCSICSTVVIQCVF